MSQVATTAGRRLRRPVRPALGVSLARSSEMQRLLEPYVGKEIAGLDLDAPTFGRLGATWEEIPHPSEILRERSEWQQRLGELYDQMLKDTDLSGIWEKRKDAVLGLPRNIPDPVTRDRRALEASDLCRKALSNVKLWQEVLGQLMDARTHGIEFAEIVWERLSRGPLAGAWAPVDVLDRPMHRFAFQKGTKRLHLRQPPGKGGIHPIPAPDLKFLALRSGSRDTPWGTPLLDDVYWLWYIKRHVHKYYAVWLERWAFPLSKVKYRHSHDDKANKEQIEEALALIQAIQTDQGIAIPDKLDIDLLESARNGSVTYDPFLAGVKAAYSLRLLGEVDTSGLGDQPGSYAKSRVSNDVRLEKVSGDAHLLESYLTETLLTWIVHVNLGPDYPVPRYRIYAEDAADRKDRREGIQAAFDAGQAVPRAYAFMTWQVPIPREDEDVIEPPAPAQQQPPGNLFPFAAPPSCRSERSEAESRNLGGGHHHLATDPDPDDLAATHQARAEEHSADLDDLVDRLHPATIDYYAAHRRAVEAAFDAGAATRGDLLRQVVRRMGTLPVAHARHLQAAGLHGAGLGLLHLRQETEAQSSLAAPSDYQRADTPEAAIEYWSRLLNVPKESFSALEDLLRRYSFTVAGVQEGALLGEINHLVEEAIATGLDRESFVGRLSQLYDNHGLTPTSDAHARLVYDNNSRQAHGATRYRQVVENPHGRRIQPYLRWATLGDDRVRHRPGHNHRVMADKIFAADHPIWNTWWYPAGHGCRCYVSIISAPEARRMGLTGSEPTGPWPTDPFRGGRAMPDDGFTAAPRQVFGQAAAAVSGRAQDLRDDAATQATADLGEALDLLWGLLGILGRLGD